MNNYSDLLIFVLVLVLWIVLNRWVLPWFGVSTCMSGGCALDRRSTVHTVDAAVAGRRQGMEQTDEVGETGVASHSSGEENQR